jgi:precorrin-6B methylase 2
LILNRGRIRYWAALLYERGWKSTVHYDRSLTVFRKLYEDINSFKLSIQERQQKNIFDSRFTYGEVVFYSFVRILEVAEPKQDEIFYDLGSGAGKAVFIAALVFDFSKVCGIEIIDNLYQLSNRLLQKLEAMPERQELMPYKKFNIEFIHSNFFEYNISEANIVFLNATCWRGEALDTIIIKLLELKKGARIILVTASLENIGGFQLKYSNLHLMSWGLSTVRIYQRI